MTSEKGGVRSDATVVGRGPVALSCLGQCASAHNLHAMECPREVRAVRRALIADGPQGADSVWAQHPAAW